jgi:EmrB/QacA subfamily drug resistance transporter
MVASQEEQMESVTLKTGEPHNGTDTGKWLVFIAVGLGTFMSALDGSVVNVTLPLVSKYFSSDIAAVEWVVTIYLLIVSSLLLSFGRLGDMRGHKRIYVAGFLFFVSASALCGFSPSLPVLVGSRGLQAVGAAMLFANAPAILTRTFPGNQRGQVLGLLGMMTYLGSTVGPSLGGFLAQTYSWRAVFYINLPVGLLACFFSAKFIGDDRRTPLPEERFDIRGAVTFSAGLILLLLGLNQGQAWGWLSLPVLACLLGSVAIMLIFINFERRSPSPMLDLSLFSSRIFSASTISAMLNYVSLFCMIFLMPFYLIQGRGFSPAQAGLFLTAQPLVMIVAAPMSGWLSDRIGSRVLSTLGMGILSFGLFLLSRLGASTPPGMIVFSLGVVGLGTGIFVSPNNSALLGSAPRGRQGIASAILASARNVGMVLGVGIAGAVFSTALGFLGENSVIEAVHYGFLTAAVVAFIGILVSSVRGKDNKSSVPVPVGSV